jgi:hypothetical protein
MVLGQYYQLLLALMSREQDNNQNIRKSEPLEKNPLI